MQSGFLLVTAIFLLVVLAALGAFILTISGTQQTSSALDVQGARAYQAARAGIEWASDQLLISTGGNIAFDAPSQGNTGSTAVGSLTVSHTVGAAGTNRILVVGVNIFSGLDPFPTVSSITYAGQSMTFLAGVNNTVAPNTRIRSEMWYITAPATGANNIVITFSAVVRAVAGGMSYTGVHQTTPFGTAASAGSVGSPSASVIVASATGELVVDTVGVRQDTTGTQSLTAGAGQTQRYNDVSGTATNANVVGAGSEEAGAASVTMSWTVGSSQDWAIVAAPLRPGPNAFATACNPGPTTQNVTGMGGTLSGFTAAVTCSSTTHTEFGATVTVYQITSTGAQGTVGTLDRVERQLQVTLTK